MEPNFFTEIASLNAGTEIPQVFTRWSALAGVSAVLGRRCWIEMGPFVVYPNLYIVLIAGAGKVKKTTSLNVVNRLLLDLTVRPRFLSHSLTLQALIDDLKVTEVAESGGYTGCSQGFLTCSEMISFINKQALENGLEQLLIQLYDCEARYEYGTVSRGVQVLRDLCLSMLVATTPENFGNAIPERLIGSGLASRMIFVFCDATRPVAWPCYTPHQLRCQQFCTDALARMQRLQGPIKLSPEVRAWGENFYVNRCWNSSLYENRYLSGYASRRFIHWLKLSICLAAGLTESLEITIPILEMSEAFLLQNEAHLQTVIQLVTMNEQGNTVDYVRSQIYGSGEEGITREILMQRTNHKLNARELIDVLDTLVKSGQIVSQSVGGNPQNIKIIYRRKL